MKPFNLTRIQRRPTAVFLSARTNTDIETYLDKEAYSDIGTYSDKGTVKKLLQSDLDLVILQIVKFLDLVKFLLLTDFLLNKTLEIVKFLPIFWKFNILI